MTTEAVDRPTDQQARVGQLLRRLARYYPFSVFGTVVLIAAVLLLGTGLMFSDILAVSIGTLAFAFCLLLSVAVFLQPADRLKNLLNWNSGANLIAQRVNTSHNAALHTWKPPPFLRLHISIGAWLQIGRLKLYYFHRDYSFYHSSPHAAGNLPLEICPPVPGRLKMRGEFYLSDMFGITHRSLVSERRSARVLPPAENMSDITIIPNNRSEDDVQPQKKSESEKIFIRDYQAGDLARDINWKASGRIHKLLTRIPPESESQSRVVHATIIADVSDSGFMELAYLKSLLRGFIEVQLNADTMFRIWLNDQKYEVMGQDDDALPAFLRSLAEWCPSPQSLPPGAAPDIELNIFSHETCGGLGTIIGHFEHYNLFLVRNWRGGHFDRVMARLPGEGFLPLRLPLRLPVRLPRPRPRPPEQRRFRLTAGFREHAREFREYILKKEW